MAHVFASLSFCIDICERAWRTNHHEQGNPSFFLHKRYIYPSNHAPKTSEHPPHSRKPTVCAKLTTSFLLEKIWFSMRKDMAFDALTISFQFETKRIYFTYDISYRPHSKCNIIRGIHHFAYKFFTTFFTPTAFPSAGARFLYKYKTDVIAYLSPSFSKIKCHDDEKTNIN